MTGTEEAARRWAEAWRRCWDAGDVDGVVALYAAEATFSSEPFRSVRHGREAVRAYVAGAFGAESEVRSWFGEPIVDGERAAVEWWAALREDGEEVTLAGTSLLLFGADGLVLDQRDTWNVASGRHEPPPGWER